MASTYSTSLKIQLIGNGEQSGIWGSTTDANWNLMEQAVAGVQTIVMANANYTLSNLNGVSDEARNMALIVQGTNSAIYQVVAPLVPKFYVISNQTTGGYAITIGGSSGNYVTIPNGYTSQVYCDGINFYPAQTSSAGNWNVSGNCTVGGNLSVTGTITGNWAYMPSGTTVLFYQASAPTGWTQNVSLNDYALRVVSGAGGSTGGSVAFSSAFVSQAVTGSVSIATATGTVGGTALTTAQLPAHNHGINDPGHAHGVTDPSHAHGISDPGHSHTYYLPPVGGVANCGSCAGVYYNGGLPGANSTSVVGTGISINGAYTNISINGAYTGISTQSTGSGNTHTHSLTMNAQTGTFSGNNINLAVQYVNVIICSKN